ncbi:MAG: SHOCT domain-containing protein [Solirubrobacteraceae bacterium]
MPQQQQPIRVVVEKKGGCFSGCGTTLAIMVLLGLTIQYWHVALGIVAIAVVTAMVRSSKERDKARHRSGPRDPWLNEVAVALADLGLKEVARNTGEQLGGVPIDGDIGLEVERLKVYVTLFSDQRRARQAELGLRAKPGVRDAVSNGATAIKTVDRVVYVANGRGGVVDEFRLDEVVRVVGRLAVPPPLATARVPPHTVTVAPPSTWPIVAAPGSDVLEQLRKLGELRNTGVLTETEFEAKKAELLARI